MYGESVAAQTDGVFYHASAFGVTTFTTDVDIILTGIAWNISNSGGGAARTVSILATIDGNTIVSFAATCDAAGQIAIGNKVDLPRWLLKAGSVLQVTIAGTGAPYGTFLFSGYLA